jgi:sec-independent protein translocase protein TatA
MGFRYWPHILVLAIIALVIFGGPKLPDFARNLGKTLRILKDEAKSLTSDDEPKDAEEADEGSGKSSAKDESNDK